MVFTFLVRLRFNVAAPYGDILYSYFEATIDFGWVYVLVIAYRGHSTIVHVISRGRTCGLPIS